MEGGEGRGGKGKKREGEGREEGKMEVSSDHEGRCWCKMVLGAIKAIT